MMTRCIQHFTILILFLSLSNCKTNSPKYKTLDDETLIDLVINNTLPDPANLTIKDVAGGIVENDSLRKLQSTGNYWVDFMVDDSSNIVEGLVRPITDEDKKLIERINERFNEGPPLKDVSIDCTKLDSILEEVERTDQAVRTKNNNEAEMMDVDHRNLEIVMSVIDKCGMPTALNQAFSIWVVIQHSQGKYRKQLLPEFKDLAAKGILEKSSVALMEDRVLMDDGLPQIYGSQVSKQNGGDWELHELRNPETVDRRRAEIGLGPLKEYLSRFGVEFNVEQE